MTNHKTLAEAIKRTRGEGDRLTYTPEELEALETAFLELWARVQELERHKLRLEGRLWSIGHAAGCETREDLMRSALDMLPQPQETDQ